MTDKKKQIKSTDWLTKNYSKEELAEMKAKADKEAEEELKQKQIAEMANDLAKICPDLVENCCGQVNCVTHLTLSLSKIGYRKERQGHWFIREYEFFTCSECGHDYWNSCDCTKEAKEKLADGDTPNYCPNCGAKMKGE